jgi:hypothetical protein
MQGMMWEPAQPTICTSDTCAHVAVWGSAVMSDCIWCAAADGIDQYYDDVLDYTKFSLRLSHADIPRLPQILASVSVQRRAALQQVAPCKWRPAAWLLHPADTNAPRLLA